MIAFRPSVSGLAVLWLGLIPIQGSSDTDQEFPATRPYVERVRSEGRHLDLSLKEAVRLALTNNLEIAIEDFNEEVTEQRIFATRGDYDPVLSFSTGWSSNEWPSTSILDAGRDIPTSIRRGLDLNTSVQQPVKGGGALRMDLNNVRNSTNSLFSIINPNFESYFNFSFTQPLWRGFRETQTERQLKLYNLDRRINESQFEERVSGIILRLRTEYWELVSAIDIHETRRQSREQAVLQHELNKRRVAVGISAPMEVSRTRAEVSNREQVTIQAEVQIVIRQNALKRLLTPDRSAPLWNLRLIPTDRPRIQPLGIMLEEAIEQALKRRPELERLNLELEQNRIDRDFYKKEGKPRVNLRANVGSYGRSGQVFKNVDFFGALTREPDPANPFYGNFGNSMGQALGFDYISYGIFVDVEIPLRNRRNEGQLAETAIAQRRLRHRQREQEQVIVEEVRNAYERLGIQKRELDMSVLAVRFAQEQLELETKRFKAGLSTNFELLQYQRDVAEARLVELRSQIDYQLALTGLRQAMNTIIDDQDLVVAQRSNSK